MNKFILFIFSLLIISNLKSQNGRISGTIIDSKTGETLPGAMVVIEGTGKGGVADFDGKFSINNVSQGKVTLLVSYISYDNKKITDVEVKANDITDIAIQLTPSSSKELKEVEVVVTLNKENNTALVLQQKNNSSVSDGISAETIKRTPDRNSADVLKRISGVTIQDDKFVIVRGLNERYNASYLNGAPLPSTEPDKKAFAFDLFPSNMLDNIIVNKTATPDMPSEFAGGIIQINTKSIPDKNFISIGISGGYNTITTGKSKIIYEGGKYDKFGFDDGSRGLPNEIPAFKDKKTWITNSDQARMATYFKNDWAYSNSKFNPNSSIQLAMGRNFKLKERDFFGVIFSLGYNSTQNLYTMQRKEYYNLSPSSVSTLSIDQIQQEQNYNQNVYHTQTSTGALLNLSCKINNNNSISFKNLINGNADNKFINSTGSANLLDANPISNINNARFFSANKILSSQINGEHYLEKSKVKFNWNVAQSRIKRTVPNMRYTAYTRFKTPIDQDYPNPKDTIYGANIANGSTAGPDYAGYRVYSSLNETMTSFKGDVSRIFKINDKLKVEGKAGGLYQSRNRQFNIRQFGFSKYQKPGMFFADSLAYLPEDQIFSSQNMSVTPDGFGGFKLIEITQETDNYYAASILKAGFAMAEIKYTEKLRIIGGVRYEKFNQQVKISYTNPKEFDSTFVNTNVSDILPSLNLIYNINEKFGIRLAYYKTLNRPEFRELAVTNWYDPETRLSIAGNDTLKRCFIKNYDARFEYYPGRGQLITVSGFYKYFNNPIERYISPGDKNQITYNNANFAKVYGAELEYRINIGSLLKLDSIKFLNNLNLFSNLSLIKSEVNVKGFNPALPDTREMQGQAPYIINTGISYVDNDNNFSVTAMLNRVGPRIYLVGSDYVPNRWENSRTVIDLQATKSFFKNRLELRFNVKDLLHQNWIVYYNMDNNKNFNEKNDLINFKRNYGSTYSFAISYKF